MEESHEIRNEKEKLGCAPYAIGGASFIPLLGVPLGLVAIVWGLVKIKAGGVKLAIIGACGILFTIALYGTLFYKGFVEEGGIYDDLKGQMAQSLVNDLIKNIEYYKLENGHYPKKLEELLPEKQNQASFTFIYEPFMRLNNLQPKPFNYGVIDGGEHYYLFSSGPDGVPGSTDDIYPIVSEEGMERIGYRINEDANHLVESTEASSATH